MAFTQNEISAIKTIVNDVINDILMPTDIDDLQTAADGDIRGSEAVVEIGNTPRKMLMSQIIHALEASELRDAIQSLNRGERLNAQFIDGLASAVTTPEVPFARGELIATTPVLDTTQTTADYVGTWTVSQYAADRGLFNQNTRLPLGRMIRQLRSDLNQYGDIIGFWVVAETDGVDAGRILIPYHLYTDQSFVLPLYEAFVYEGKENSDTFINVQVETDTRPLPERVELDFTLKLVAGSRTPVATEDNQDQLPANTRVKVYEAIISSAGSIDASQLGPSTQYSPDNMTWHNSPQQAADNYFRFAVGSGAYSEGISIQNPIIDMRTHRPDLSGVAVNSDEWNMWLRSVGIGNEGLIYSVEVFTAPGHTVMGTWNQYGNANFIGVTGGPPRTELNKYYYDATRQQFYQFLPDPITGATLPRGVSPQDALGANVVFLFNRENADDALHAVTAFDSNNAYFAEFENAIYQLDNSSYSAPTSPSQQLEFVPSNKINAREISNLTNLIAGKADTSAIQSAVDAAIGTLANSVATLQTTITEKADRSTVTQLGIDLRAERLGVPLIEGTTNKRRVQNANVGRPPEQLIDSISFSGTLLRQVDMDDYDRILLELYELADDDTIIDSTTVVFRYAHWNSLLAVPYPSQAAYQDATLDDNRSINAPWRVDPIARRPIGGGTTANTRAQAAQQSIQDAVDEIRANTRTIYIGKSIDNPGQANPAQVLVAISGVTRNFDIAAYGYR